MESASGNRKSKNSGLIEKQRQIVKGACKVFFETGFHPTTIRQIAKACGMSMGQLYYYISSKDDVLYLIHEHMQKVFFDEIMKSGYKKSGEPLQTLIAFMKVNMRFVLMNKELIQFIYTESKYLDKEHLRRVLKIDNQNVVGYWRKVLKELNEKMPMKCDVNFAANLISYLNVFFALRGWNIKPTNKNLQSLSDFILRGLGYI